MYGLLCHSCISSHEQGWAELLGGLCSQFPEDRLSFSAPDQLSLGDLCLGIWGAQNIYPTCAANVLCILLACSSILTIHL